MATSIHYQPQIEPDFSGPSWNNSNEYPSLTSNEFTYDRQQLDSLLLRLEQALGDLAPLAQADQKELVVTLQSVCEMEEQAWILLGNMRVYANCLLCVDGDHTEARAALSQLASLSGKLEAITKPAHVYLAEASGAFVEAYLDRAHVKPYEFQLRQRRLVANTLLSEAEESLLARMKTNGPFAFGALYDQLSSSIRCTYQNSETGETQSLGLAQAQGLIRDGDPVKREKAWRSIQGGWKSQEVAAAGILNGLAGWRLELTQQKSARRRAKLSPNTTPDLHFLDLPLHESRISSETLTSMMAAVHSKIEMPRRAMRLMAKAHGKAKMDPWDLLAPAPTKASERMTFEKGFGLIREAFDAVHPSLSDFVDTMKKNRWIEGRQLLAKRPGAFCTGYPKSSSPRVFQTYMGSLVDVRTLAHELGHAYHSWVMRDLPPAIRSYPMTIAETASIFAETAFSDSLMARAHKTGDRQLALEIAWQNAESASSLLLNIPARFDFEKSFYERRQSGYVSPDELGQLMARSWEKWYGDTLSEYETQYWMTKLHFSMAHTSFYNYPYTFGYLFSLGIYALKDELGSEFWPTYTALLRETGRMTAEELATKYLGVDLKKPDFWFKSLAIVERQIAEFETAAGRLLFS